MATSRTRFSNPALSGANNFATALLFNACPHLAKSLSHPGSDCSALTFNDRED